MNFSTLSDEELYRQVVTDATSLSCLTEIEAYIQPKYDLPPGIVFSKSVEDILITQLRGAWCEAQSRSDVVEEDIKQAIFNNSSMRITCFGELLREGEAPKVLPFPPAPSPR